MKNFQDYFHFPVQIHFSTLVIFFSVFSTPTHADTYTSPAETVGWKSFEWMSRTSYFQTSSHIDALGNKIALTGQESFSRLEEEISVRYGLKRYFDIKLGGRYRSQQNVVDKASAGYFDLSSSGFESVVMGAKYSLVQNAQQILSIEAYFRTPTTGQDNYVDSLPYRTLDLGDDAREMGLSGWFTQKSLNGPWITGGLTYQYRTDDFSHEILYLIEAAYRKKSWALIGGLDGLYSLKTDPYEGSATGRPKRHVGTTQLYNSLNRAWMKPYGGLLFSVFKRGQVGAYYKQTISGVSTDLGSEVFIDLKWKIDGIKDEQIKEQSFKEYEIEASVTKVSPREIFVKIDRGIVDDLKKGMSMDIYQFDYLGGNILVARGKIYEIDANNSVVRVEKKYRDIPLKIGFVVRGNYP